MKYCKKCGKELKDGAKFCSACGTPWGDEEQAEAQSQKPEKKQAAAPGKKKNLLIPILCAAAFCLILGAGGVFSWNLLGSGEGGLSIAAVLDKDKEDSDREKSRLEEDREEEEEEEEDQDAEKERDEAKRAEEESLKAQEEETTASESAEQTEAETAALQQTEEALASVSYLLQVVNCNESITLRPGPSTSSGEICQIPLGAQVSFLSGAGDGFLRISYEGQEGYSMGAYLKAADGAYPSLQVVNCNESITLRPGPSTSSGEICQIPLGAQVGFVAGAGDGFYEIWYNGQQGYALSSYLGAAAQTEGTGGMTAGARRSAAGASMASAGQGILNADQNPARYTYDYMTKDLEVLAQTYPQLVKLDSLADTPDGRKLWHMTIGDPGAERQFLVNASIHAREYATAWLVMCQASDFLRDCQEPGFLPEDVAVHVVPMVNPDGVSISQMGLDGCIKQETKDLVTQIMERECQGDEDQYLKRWKANGQGIDLNRNFDALWEQYEDGVGQPSADHYKGTAPGCAPEAAALIRLTEQYPFERTISYHTQGSVIYWNFGQTGQLKTQTEEFARSISNVTGYTIDGNYSALDPAGYKDWAISKKGIPSLTIEVGRQTSPVSESQFPTIWQENQDVWKVMIGL